MRNIWVVCHGVRFPENLGAVCRAMANFGAEKLILAEPATHDFRGAEKMAVGAEHILKTFSIAESVQEGISKATYAVGTTSRAQLKRTEIYPLKIAAERIRKWAERGPVAIVFGNEKRGLSDDELSHCQEALFIETGDQQPSMNLSHAVAVVLHAVATSSVAGGNAEKAKNPAPLGLLQLMEKTIEDVMTRVEFLNPQAPKHGLKEMINALTRHQLTQAEAAMWKSAFEHIARELPKSK